MGSSCCAAFEGVASIFEGAVNRVDLLAPDYSQYEVQHYFTERIAESFERLNFSCRILKEKNKVNQVLEQPPDLIFIVNGSAFVNSQHVCDLLKIPQISYLIDPAFRFVDFMESSHLIFACDDRSSCSFLDLIRYPYSLFMPHAVEKDLDFDPVKERKYEISINATFIDCEAVRKAWRETLPPELSRVMEEAAELSLEDETTPFTMALIQALASSSSFDLNDSELLKTPFFRKMFQDLEMYIKGRDRIDLIQAISKKHCVHLFGNNEESWKNYFRNNSNVIVHQALFYQDALNVMKESKIVLNSSIKNKNGAHERIFAASACGAVVVTNDNTYMKENFVHGKEIILFRRSNYTNLLEQIQMLLNDEKKRKEVAAAGRAKVMANHTWDHRIEKLLKDIDPMVKQMH